MKKVIFRISVILLIIIGLILLCFLYRFVKIKIEKQKHQITSEKGIDKVLIENIGGIDQYFYIRGQNINNPVILMINGGLPMIPMLHLYQYDWENNYTIVNWDRRGSGETYFLNIVNAEEITATMQDDILINDISEAVDMLYSYFGNRKIIILADSMGTTLASRYVMEHPEKIECYIGSAQVTDLQQDMALCARDMEQIATDLGKDDDAAKIKDLAARLPDDDSYTTSFSPLIQYGSKYISKESGWDSIKMYFDGLSSPYFPINHLSYYFKADELKAPIYPYIQNFNIEAYGLDYQVPVAFLIGENDFITKYTIKDYYEKVNAPHKELRYIPNAGHDALQQNPDAFYATLKEVLAKQ